MSKIVVDNNLVEHGQSPCFAVATKSEAPLGSRRGSEGRARALPFITGMALNKIQSNDSLNQPS
jgi:hypothetical protein